MLKRCNYCIMDNGSDKTFKIDEDGICNYCKQATNNKNFIYFPNEVGERKLNHLIAELKEKGRGKKYDCLMGISGGLDSSYLLYLGYKWKLRILAIHVDDGFDTEIAQNNIAALIKKTGVELINIKPNSEQYNDLLRAYFMAGVPNLAIPQDNVLFAAIYKYARDNKVYSFLSGANFALECILQKGNTYTAYDLTNLKAIHKLFGEKRIDKLPLISEYQRLWDNTFYRIKTVRPLNYLDYNKERAMKELHDFCGFKYYGRKHHENLLTRFIQEYYFFTKFGVDKRTSHLSSMIVSGQLTRERALELMQEPLLDYKDLENDITLILKALNVSKQEFENVMAQPPKQHTEYKTSQYSKIFSIVYKFYKLAKFTKKYVSK